MNDDLKEKLKLLHKRAKCAKCKSRGSYTNPLAKCWECGCKFCYDHIWGGQVVMGMEIADEVRNVCDQCQEAKGYFSVDELGGMSLGRHVPSQPKENRQDI